MPTPQPILLGHPRRFTVRGSNPAKLPRANIEPNRPRLGVIPSCPHNRTHKPRNLVVNIDGTSNQLGEKSTNVVELFSRLISDSETQLVYYNSGIGTYARPSFRSWNYIKQILYHAIDTAIAWNFEGIVQAAYKWLSENYEPGDRIFLFGFSRGAYQVRVIAGMIEKVGLLHKGNESQIPFAYELYASSMDHGSRSTSASTSKAQETGQAPEAPGEPDSRPDPPQSKEDRLCAQFKRGYRFFRRCFQSFRGKSLPETISGMGHVCHFRHALALDECRAKFQPEYVNGGLGPRDNVDCGDVKEVWFAGSHSDIGGGNVFNEHLANFGPSLRWMTYEAMLFGLLMKPYEGTWSDIKPTESLTFFWKFMEYLPLGALSYQDENSLTWRPHLGAPRIIQPGQLIHQSVFGAQDKVISHALVSVLGNETEEVHQGGFLDSNETETTPATSTSNANYSEPSADTLAPSADDTETTDSSSEGSYESAREYEDLDDARTTVLSEVKETTVSRHYTPKATFSTDLGLTWDFLFDSHSKDPGSLGVVEFDPFDNVTHTLMNLQLACLDDDTPDGWNAFHAPLSALGLWLSNVTRHTFFAEIPEAGPILLSALQYVCRQQPSDTGPREKLFRLLDIAKPIHPHEARKFTIAQIKQFSVPGSECSLRVLQSFANASIRSFHSQRSINDVRFITQDCIIFTSQVLGIIHVSIWDGSDKSPEDIFRCPGDYSEISKDDSLVAIAHRGELRLFEIHSEVSPPSAIELSVSNNEGMDDIWSLSFFDRDDVQLLATAHVSGCVFLWRYIEDGWQVHECVEGSYRPQIGCDFGAYNCIQPITNCTNIWAHKPNDPTNPDATVYLFHMTGSRRAFSVESPLGNYTASESWSGTVDVIDLDVRNDRPVVHAFKDYDQPNQTVCLQFRPDDQVLAAGSRDGRIRIWSLDTGEKIWEFCIGDEEVRSISFSPDGNQLVAGSAGGSLHLFAVVGK